MGALRQPWVSGVAMDLLSPGFQKASAVFSGRFAEADAEAFTPIWGRSHQVARNGLLGMAEMYCLAVVHKSAVKGDRMLTIKRPPA